MQYQFLSLSKFFSAEISSEIERFNSVYGSKIFFATNHGGDRDWAARTIFHDPGQYLAPNLNPVLPPNSID